MAGRPRRRCTTPYCPRPATKRGPCTQCAAARDARYERAGRAIYNTERWRRLSRDLLDARVVCDRPRCTTRAEQVDHVIAIADGGQPWAEDNLEVLCRRHHGEKTALEVGLGTAQPAKARPRRRARGR